VKADEELLRGEFESIRIEKRKCPVEEPEGTLQEALTVSIRV